MRVRLAITLAALAGAGCTPTPPLPEVPISHPASTNAAESPVPPRPAVLSVTEGVQTTGEPASRPAGEHEPEPGPAKHGDHEGSGK